MRGADGGPRWSAEEAEQLIDQLQQQAAQLQEQAAEMELMNDELSGSEARLRGVFEASLDAIIVTDTASRILEWNHQAEALFGWSAQEAVGRTLGETIIPARFRADHDRGVRHYLATGQGPILNRRIRIAALRRDGHELPVELTVAPARWGTHVVFTAFVRDLTEHE
ncbi:MAG TPA: PAS domain S-box protein, partial [Longimicrobium sp.]|nr:PAS domain S-box protein [Longimicrobium sp.]